MGPCYFHYTVIDKWIHDPKYNLHVPQCYSTPKSWLSWVSLAIIEHIPSSCFAQTIHYPQG